MKALIEHRTSSLIRGILGRPVTVLMICLMLISFGGFALWNLKTTFFPSVNIPVVAITMNYANVAPEDMQRIIVEPVEGAIASVEGVKSIEGSIRRGNAFLRMELEDGVAPQEVEIKVREAVDRIRGTLPREASPPIVFQFDPENFPIMGLSIRSSVRSLEDLREYSVKIAEPLLERIEGVASAETQGGLTRLVKIELDEQKMRQHNLLPLDVEQAIRNNNVQVAAGNIREGRLDYAIRSVSFFEDLEEIQQTIVKNDNNTPIRVRDVSQVIDGFQDINTLVEINGKNSVSIEIQKKSDANTVDVTDAVLATLSGIENALPDDVELAVQFNQGEFITASIDNLTNTALQAFLFVALILLLFMGGWRSALVVCISIPVSLAITFTGMYFLDISLNVISITGLALSVGLLVDNSIVVLESIIGKLEEGEDSETAALNGTSEIKFALIGATMTTLGVFIPLLGLSGFSGQIARDLSLTICIAIASSWFASMAIVPLFGARFLKGSHFNQNTLINRLILRLEHGYGESLRWLLNRSWVSLILVVALSAGVVVLFMNIETEFFPESDTGEFNISIEMPTGTKLVNTAQVMRNISRQLTSMPEIKTVVTSIGQRGWISEPNRGSISVTLVPLEERDKSTNDITLALRRRFNIPGAQINISSGGGFGPRGRFGGASIRATLIGPDIAVLKGLGERLKTRILQDTSVISADYGRTDEAPELAIILDRERISRMGESVNSISSALKTQARGTQVGFFRTSNREIPIEVRLPKEQVNDRSSLRQFTVAQVNGQGVPFSQVSSIEPIQGLSRLSRRDRESVLDISIRVKGNAAPLRGKITNLVQEEIPIPDGYRLEFTGARRDEQEGQRELGFALLSALALTFMIMAAQFERFSLPFIVMITIPLAFFGSLAMLHLTGTALGATAAIGIVILVGIVVNNGIVLVDYILYATRNASTETFLDTFIAAARDRMRPILLTALTTICSMIPLSLGFGSGAETWSPLARSVIGGLSVSTLLTLFLVPTILLLFGGKRLRNRGEIQN